MTVMHRPPEEEDEAKMLVGLFALAHQRAQQLYEEGAWGEDLFLNASAGLHLYDAVLQWRTRAKV